MKEINKKGSLLFIGIVVVLIFTALIPIVRQQQESERDKEIFRILVSSENEDAAAILQDFAGKERSTWSLTRHRPWI